MAQFVNWASRYGWWLGLSAVVVALMVGVTGWWGLIVYAALNAGGTAFFLLGGHSSRRREVTLGAFTALQVPVGLVAAFFSRGSDRSHVVFDDRTVGDHTRRAGSVGPVRIGKG